MSQSPEKVEIRYTHPSLVSRFGSKPFLVTVEMAKHYENQGLARIMTSPPQSNPTLTQEEVKELENKYSEQTVSYMPEQELLVKICWISGGYLDRQISETGKKFGFDVMPVYPGTFSPGKLIVGDLIVLNSDMRGFSGGQILNIRSVLFQKCKPYIYRMVNEAYDVSWERHALSHSLLNIFVNEKIFDAYLDLYEDLIGDDWLIESKADDLHTQLWVSVERILEKIQ